MLLPLDVFYNTKGKLQQYSCNNTAQWAPKSWPPYATPCMLWNNGFLQARWSTSLTAQKTAHTWHLHYSQKKNIRRDSWIFFLFVSRMYGNKGYPINKLKTSRKVMKSIFLTSIYVVYFSLEKNYLEEQWAQQPLTQESSDAKCIFSVFTFCPPYLV